MMTTQMTETRKAFHDELAELISDVVRLGALACESIEMGTNTLLECDLSGIEKLVAADHDSLDALTHSIEQRSCLLLARQQPMAVDLRTLVTILRVIHEIERVGDLMVKVAKSTRRLYPTQLDPKVRGIIDRMRDQAREQLTVAVDSFQQRDLDKAAALPDMDDVMDDLQRDLFQAIFSTVPTDEGRLQTAVNIALVGRHFERMADHAVNIAERVAFMVTGHFAYEDHDETEDD
jgi:phosphate transport system protein